MTPRERMNEIRQRLGTGRMLFGFSVFLSVIVGLLIFRSVMRSDGQSLANSGKPPAVTDAAAADAAIVQSIDRERRSLNRVKLQAAQVKVGTVQATLKELKAERAAFDEQVRALLADERGRRIAASEEHLQQFVALQRQKELWTQAQIEGAEARLQTLNQPIEDAAKADTGDYAPSTDWSSHLDREQLALSAALTAYRETRQSVEVVIRDSAGPPGDSTLADAITELDEALARQRAERVQLALEEEQHQKTEQLVAAEAESRKKQSEQEVAEVELATLRRLAEDPTVQAKYQPFLAKGRFRFDHGNIPAKNQNYYLYIDGPSTPPSYNVLVNIGVTRDLKTFAAAGVGKQGFRGPLTKSARYFHKNDRPLWTTPYPSTDAQWEYYRVLFKEFRQLAPIWRDMGVLKP